MCNYVPSINEGLLISDEKSHATTGRFFYVARLISFLIVLNVFDGLFTIFWCHTERAIEANPLMCLTLNIHPVLFMTVKITLVYLGVAVLLRYWRRPFVKVSLALSVWAYGIVLVHHCINGFSSLLFVWV